jgi:IclR family KDG regulon transcriptional repressor
MSSIEKALDILEIVQRKGEISLKNLANMTNRSVSTTHRICNMLVKRRYLYQQGNRGKYSLGYKFLEFCDINRVGGNIKNEAKPFLNELFRKISETVVISLFDGDEIVDIDYVVPDLIIQAVPVLIPHSPYHCTAVGKVFLAHMPNEKIDEILSSTELTVYTDLTISDVDRLRSELLTVVSEGIAYDNEEFIVGLRSAAAPIRGENGEVFACVSYLAPSSRVNPLKMKQWAPLVKACALSISEALGYKNS